MISQSGGQTPPSAGSAPTHGGQGALRLGTRGSPLALRQAALVAQAIEEEVEIVVLRHQVAVG